MSALDKLKQFLTGIEEPKHQGDDFEVAGWSGGNYDDAYSLGIDEGQRLLAEEIRALIGDE